MRRFRKTTTILLMLLVLTPAMAQRKQIGEAKTILLRGKDFAKAEKLMTDLLKDSANQENTRIYDIWLQAVEKQYSQLNEQMYMKQKVDTAQLFTLTKRLFTIAEQLDSIDMKPDKKGKVNPEYRKDNSQKMAAYRPNLFYGGAYYVRKQDYKQAYDLFETYIDCARQPLFVVQDLMNTDERLGEAAYWTGYCGYRMNDPVLTLRYHELSRRDTARLEHTLLYAAEAWKQLNDDERYQVILTEGFKLNPKSNYFFPRLLDSYTARGNYQKANMVVDQALKTDSLNELFLFAKSTILLNMGAYADCINVSDRLIKLNHESAEAYYNAGTACMNMALGMDSRTNKKQIKKMYQRALPYMEAYRRMAPQQTQKWATALYRIYFNLNMGKQFDEMDKLLKSKK